MIFLHPMLAPNADRAVGYEMQVDSSQIFITDNSTFLTLFWRGFVSLRNEKNDKQIQQNIKQINPARVDKIVQ